MIRGLYIHIHIYINRVRKEKEMGKLKIRLQSIITEYIPFEEKVITIHTGENKFRFI
jgi:hypothetical protein